MRSLRALTPELKGCGDCLLKAGAKALGTNTADREPTLMAGRRAMRVAANIALSIADPPRMSPAYQKCGHCGGRVLPLADGKSTPMWCLDCEQERKRYGSPRPPSEALFA